MRLSPLDSSDDFMGWGVLRFPLSLIVSELWRQQWRLWPPCIAGCGHIYFHPVVSFFYLFFISSPNLSGRILDTSTHGVALVQIYNACLKLAAPLQISAGFRQVLTIGKKVVKQQYLLYMFWQYGELWPTSGWDLLASLGQPCKFQWVSPYCTAL